MTDRYIIGQTIAALRKDAGLTQTELADRLHVSHQAISQWERGETMPDILTLPALAEIFGQPTGVLLGLEEMSPAQTGTEPAETLFSQAEQSVPLEEDYNYTVVLEKNGVKVQSIPADIRKQIIIVLEGNCRNLTSAFTTEIRGNVQGNAEIAGGAHIGEWIGGDTAISGGANIGGDICGDCCISGGAQISGSVTDGNLVLSGQATINGSVTGGDITTDSPLTICGNTEGDIHVHDGSDASVTVQGYVEGDIYDCGTLTVGGSIAGDVDCGDLSVAGDIGGDVDCGDLSVAGDIGGNVDCGDLSVAGDIGGDVDSGSLTVGGDIGGDVDCGSLEAHGDINGDVDCGDCHVEGNVTGDIDCGDCRVEGNVDGDISASGDVQILGNTQ